MRVPIGVLTTALKLFIHSYVHCIEFVSILLDCYYCLQGRAIQR